MDATTPKPQPGITAAFAGVATVREAVVAIDADFCILMDASASMSVRDVAGLDEQQRSRVTPPFSRSGSAPAVR